MATTEKPDHVDALLVGGIVIVAAVVVVAWLRDARRDGLTPAPRRDGIDPETIAAARRLTNQR